jgi:uncharacterized membrane protein
MTYDTFWLTAGLAIGTYAIRLGGALAGQHLARFPVSAEALSLLPGSLIVSLVALSLVGQPVWVYGVAAASLGVAWVSRSLILTMVIGMGLFALANFYTAT